MSARGSIRCLLAGTLLTGGCQPSAADLTDADKAAVTAVVKDVTRTLQSADYAAWAALFSEDAVIYSPNTPALKGRAVLQKWGEAFPPITDLTFSNVEVRGRGNIAYATSGYTFATKGSPADTGKQLWVFRRLPGGKWEVAAASYSSALPVPAQQNQAVPPSKQPD